MVSILDTAYLVDLVKSPSRLHQILFSIFRLFMTLFFKLRTFSFWTIRHYKIKCFRNLRKKAFRFLIHLLNLLFIKLFNPNHIRLLFPQISNRNLIYQRKMHHLRDASPSLSLQPQLSSSAKGTSKSPVDPTGNLQLWRYFRRRFLQSWNFRGNRCTHCSTWYNRITIASSVTRWSRNLVTDDAKQASFSKKVQELLLHNLTPSSSSSLAVITWKTIINNKKLLVVFIRPGASMTSTSKRLVSTKHQLTPH